MLHLPITAAGNSPAAPPLRALPPLAMPAPIASALTDFIRHERLLAADEIDRIAREAPIDLIRFQDVAAMIRVGERRTMRDWLDRFNAGADALQRPPARAGATAQSGTDPG
jgi:hypothetical protein